MDFCVGERRGESEMEYVKTGEREREKKTGEREGERTVTLMHEGREKLEKWRENWREKFGRGREKDGRERRKKKEEKFFGLYKYN